MPNIFFHLPTIMRLHAPTGYLLSFFPACFGLLLAYEQEADLIYLPIFFLGSVLARGAGCIINDIFDRDLDNKVARTKNRPLACGDLNVKQALILLIILLCICFCIVLTLTKTSIYIAFLTVLMVIIYPLMKRVTHFPQVFLGLTFNMGCLIGYAAIKDNISLNAIILYTACGFWTLAYDTIYAFMDIVDDKIVGIKSTAIYFEHKNYKLFLSFFYFLFCALFAYAFQLSLSYISIIIILTCMIVLIWSCLSLNITDEKNCLKRFKLNNYIGFALFFAILLEKLI